MPKKWIMDRRRTLWLCLATLASIGVQETGEARVLNQLTQACKNQENSTMMKEASLKKKRLRKA